MIENEYQQNVDDNGGFCGECLDVTMYGVDGEAVGEICPECGEPAVFGMIAAVMYGVLEVEG